MERTEFEGLLLKTLFACMACDQAIDPSELQLIRSMASKSGLFQGRDLDAELDAMRQALNTQGYAFFRHYFAELAVTDLSEAEQLELLDTAVAMVEADEEIEYREIRFVKLIRSELPITDDHIAEQRPALREYLKEDIAEPFFKDRLLSQFFVEESFPVIEFPDLPGAAGAEDVHSGHES